MGFQRDHAATSPPPLRGRAREGGRNVERRALHRPPSPPLPCKGGERARRSNLSPSPKPRVQSAHRFSSEGPGMATGPFRGEAGGAATEDPEILRPGASRKGPPRATTSPLPDVARLHVLRCFAETRSLEGRKRGRSGTRRRRAGRFRSAILDCFRRCFASAPLPPRPGRHWIPTTRGAPSPPGDFPRAMERLRRAPGPNLPPETLNECLKPGLPMPAP
jgi:hypothetical protein